MKPDFTKKNVFESLFDCRFESGPQALNSYYGLNKIVRVQKFMLVPFKYQKFATIYLTMSLSDSVYETVLIETIRDKTVLRF